MKVIAILGLLVLSAFSLRAQSDSLYIRKKSANKLWLGDVATKRPFVPKRKYNSNIEILSFRPVPMRFARLQGGGPCLITYAPAKMRALPSWIGEMKNLKELDLIGIKKIDLAAELPKLCSLEKLQTLWIDPETCDENLLAILGNFRHLTTLKIRASMTEQQLTALQNKLPGCRIAAGLFADY